MTAPKRFALRYLTDKWEWDGAFDAGSPDQAKAVARGALEALVRDEAPDLACVTLFDGETRLGVWDWVQGQPYWTGADEG